MHTQSLRVHGTADAGERGTAEAGNEKLEVPKWPWPGDQKRPDQARTGQKRIKKVQHRWVAATAPVVHLWSNMQVQAATATAGDIPSWFLRRPCPKEIREDLVPANQCRAPATETRMRSHCTGPVCHTEPPAQANRLWTIEPDSPLAGGKPKFVSCRRSQCGWECLRGNRFESPIQGHRSR